MKYQIDQSGKIEDTNKITIIAYANGNCKTLSMKATEKQKLLNKMRILDKPKKTFIYKAFAGLIYLLLKDIKINEVIIDKEYPGKVKAEEVLNLFNQKKSWRSSSVGR